MNKILLPYFGELQLTTDDFIEAAVEIEFSGRKILLDIAIEASSSVNAASITLIRAILTDINSFDTKNLEFIANDFASYHPDNDTDQASISYEHLSFYLDEDMEDFINEVREDVATIIKSDDSDFNKVKKLATHLQLVRVGFYSNQNEETVIFDYCLDDEISDQLLVVRIEKGSDWSLAWES